MSREQHAVPAPEPASDWGLSALSARTYWDETRPSFRDRLRWWFLGQHAEPPASVMGLFEDPVEDRIGICCSGGGIRSASFNLGALQAVQKAGKLQEAKYLAAVSGGSYIAAAFSMVAKTWDPGPPDPPGDDSDPAVVTQKKPPFYEGSPEEQYLRNRASYLAPSGFAKLLAVWRIVCGLAVNLLYIGSVLTLVAAALALYYRHEQRGLVVPPNGTIHASPSHDLVLAAASLAAFGLFLGVVSVLMRPRLEWTQKTQKALELWSIYALGAAIVIVGVEVLIPELMQVLGHHGNAAADSPALAGGSGRAIGGGFGAAVASILAAVLSQVRARIADPKDAVKAAKDANGFLQKLAPRIRHVVVITAAWVSGPLLVFGMLFVAATFQVNPSSDTWLWLLPTLAVGVFVLLNWVVGDLTSWSLHPYYRRRLCTAFALKRVQSGFGNAAKACERRQGELVPLSQTGVTLHEKWWESLEWPTLLVCAAANVSDPGATPPGRGVTSFTFSPFAIGGPLVGGIATREFEDKLQYGARDFTLPAAVAMSGAAISPSMGKLTRPSLRFLMCLANVRLGVWVPNPRRFDSFTKTLSKSVSKSVSNADGARERVKALITPMAQLEPSEREGLRGDAEAKPRLLRPRPRPRYLLKELLGWNSINDKYLYVTDGGHYENLGLVELLRRGCTKIYCFDATVGAPMANLGDAISLARSELGVEIEFADGALDALREHEDGIASSCCAVGTIAYEDSEATGTLVYARSVMTATAPWDVHAYRAGDPTFPHTSTVDQLFTDQKFEAYRVLGRCTAEQAIATMAATEEKTAAAVG